MLIFGFPVTAVVIFTCLLAYIVLFAAEFITGRQFHKEKIDKAEYVERRTRLLLGQAINNCVFSISCFVMVAVQLPSLIPLIVFTGFCILLAIGSLVFAISNNRKLVENLENEAEKPDEETKAQGETL